MMFFRQSHALRMIRSIFPLTDTTEKESEESGDLDMSGPYSSVMGFKLAK